MKKIFICIGTRPNYIKVSRFKELFAAIGYDCKIVHTGQHYDANMSTVFFDQLGIGAPDFQFGPKTGSQMEVMGEIMAEADRLFRTELPDMVMVPGDVNSSVACAIAAQRNGIPLAHIESGLRSFDMTMPEEVNRILIDAISDLYFVTEDVGIANLAREGKTGSHIHMVGNTMMDSVVKLEPHLKPEPILQSLQVTAGAYGVATFHRPVNVDTAENLTKIITVLKTAAQRTPIVFPIHPRTKNRIQEFGLADFLDHPNMRITEPLDYVRFLSVCSQAKWVLSDSGGIQGETTYMGIPCITVREHTEQPATITTGSNTLVSPDPDTILHVIETIENGQYKKAQRPPFWDGRASERIVHIVKAFFDSKN